MKALNKPLALLLVLLLLFSIAPVASSSQVSPTPTKPNIAKGTDNNTAGDISIEETSAAEWGVANRVITLTVLDSAGGNSISFTSLPIVTRSSSSNLVILSVSLTASNQLSINVAGDNAATDKLTIRNIKYNVTGASASGDVQVTIASTNPSTIQGITTSNAIVLDKLSVWTSNPSIMIGQANQAAGNITVLESTASVLSAGKSLSITIVTPGVTFSSAPIATASNNLSFTGNASLSGDYKTATWIVNTASIYPTYIDIQSIRYDVTSSVPEGDIQVSITTNDIEPVLPNTVINARARYNVVDSYAQPIIESPTSGNWYTKDSTVTVSGFAKPGSAVDVYSNDSRVGTVFANTLGGWKAQFKYTGPTKLTAKNHSEYGYYDPYPGNITRAQLAEFMCNFLSLNLVSPSTPSCCDVPTGHWAYRYIETAKAAGVMTGYPNGYFNPDGVITRAEFMNIMVSALNLVNNTNGSGFSDVPVIHWAYSKIMTGKNNGLAQGDIDNTFKPNDLLSGGAQLGQKVDFNVYKTVSYKSADFNWYAYLTNYWPYNPPGGIASYDIYRSETSGEPGVKVNQTPVTDAFYFDTGLSNNTTYYYQIAAIDPSGFEIGRSQEFAITPVGATITGKTRVVDGRLAPNQISAEACPVDFEGNPDYDRVTTKVIADIEGVFRLENLEPGYYKLKLSPPTGTPYLPEYYNNVHVWRKATYFYVDAGQVFDLGQTCLESGGALSGQMVAEDGTNLKDIFVDVYDANTGDWMARTYTDWEGYFEVVLGSGNYKIDFEPARGRATADSVIYDPARYRATQDSTIDIPRPRATADLMIGEWFDNEIGFDSATIIHLADGQVREDLDATLTVGGSVYGRVSDKRGAPVQGVRVDIYTVAGQWVDFTFTNPLGAYAINGLAAGQYKLFFDAEHSLGMGFGYNSQWYDNQTSFTSATPITVAEGTETVGIDVRLSPRVLVDVNDTTAPTITLIFSENIRPGVMFNGITLKDESNNPVQIATGISENRLVLAPQSDLAYGTTYTGVVPAGAVKDMAGIPLADNYTFTFTTKPAPSNGGGAGGGGGSGPPSDTTAPSAPQGLKVNSNKKFMHLIWSPNKEEDLAGYNIYRTKYDVNNISEVPLNVTLLGSPEYQDKTAMPGVRYNYFVVAVDKTGNKSEPARVLDVALAEVKAERIFSDVPSSAWYKGSIDTLVSKDIIGGYADGKFRPNEDVSRAEFAKMICLAMDWELINPATPSFKDISQNSWSYKYIETAKAHGIIGGYANGLFKPDKNITRAEIAKIVSGTLKLSSGGSELKDVKGHWAKEYIDACVKADIVGGYADDTYRPNKTATRAEAAKMIVGMLRSI